MELTRVSRQRAEHSAGVAPTGGDPDVLALLLGGDQANASAFPATLEAAIAGGEVAEEPIAVDAGDASKDGDGSDDAGSTIDLAIAAALALGSALAAPAADATTGTTGDGAGAAGGPGADAGAAGVIAGGVATTTGLPGEAAAAISGAATAGAAATQATSDATAVTATVADTAGDARASESKATAAAQSEEAIAAQAAKESAAADATATVPTKDAAAATSTATVAESSTPRDAHADGARFGKHADGAGAQHGASAGVEHGEIASFSSGASEQHGGLDLGSSDRPQAELAVEKSVLHSSAPAAKAVAPEAPAAASPHVDAATTTTASPATTGTTTTTAPPHDTAAARVDRLGHHPGAIEPRWGERVADAVRLSAVRGGGEIRLQLEPEGLGHIDVRLHLQADGVRAVIVAEHESTRALLTSQQQVLHEALQRSDIRLSGFTVDVGTGNGGATTFADADAQGGGAERSASNGTLTPGTSRGPDETDASAVPLGNGRVNVRV